ncbi:MAG: hypothetical protein JWM28_2117 [Chitinophagaceae bacterium]|nr:hypothetical protein [Chitinophagaceae bacterium]
MKNKVRIEYLSVFVLGIICCCKIQAQQAIDTSCVIKIGGINQWINIKGKDIDKPILLWLHGGPGASAMSYAERITGRLQKHFIVVQWDQRETGRTMALNHSPELSLQQINDDVNELITCLLKTYNRKKLFLVGNSWGGYLALKAASKYPELLEACILVSPSVYGIESEQRSLQNVMGEAKQREDKQAIGEIASIKIPFETAKDLYLLRKWMFTFHGRKVSHAIGPEDFFLKYAEKWLAVVNGFESYNPFEEIKKLECPVFFLVGQDDYITHPEITERFYNQVQAPVKKIHWFNAGHMVTTQKPRQMQETIIADIQELVSQQ